MKRADIVMLPTPAQHRKTFPMLPWYPASFMSATRGWSVTARGIYRELLDAQWEMPEGLPADAAALQQLINATKSEWKCWPRVESKFPIGSDGMRRNPTLERHRLRAADKSRKAAESAIEGWRNRRNGARGGNDASA